MRSLAGVYSGYLRVKRTQKGYVITGTLIGQFLTTANPHVKRVLLEADKGDKIVTRKELDDLAEKIFKEYAR